MWLLHALDCELAMYIEDYYLERGVAYRGVVLRRTNIVQVFLDVTGFP